MDALELVISTLDTAGGSMSYKALYDGFPPERRYELPNALKLGKQNGTVKQEVAFSLENGLSHTVTKVS